MEKENVGYKAMGSDMTCLNNYHFEVGKTYEIEKDTKLELRKNGFHFCFDLLDCLYYYPNFDGDIRFFKIQYDKVIKQSGDGCTNNITILEEINIINYIKENKDNVNWTLICREQKLSEDFMREHNDYLDWDNVSEYQDLSESFIRNFEDRVDWYLIFQYQTLSNEFRKEFKHKLTLITW